MRVEKFAVVNPLFSLLYALWDREYVLEVLYGGHVLGVPHVLLADFPQFAAVLWDIDETSSDPVQAETNKTGNNTEISAKGLGVDRKLTCVRWI